MKILEPLYDLVSWIILMLHRGFSNVGMNASWSWCLAIVGLVVMIRIALIPLFVKQIRSMRNMQVLQPQIKKIQERYKGDRERASQELMKLYKEHKTNPLSSCFPILAQAPFFFALFRVLNLASKGQTVGVLDTSDVAGIDKANFLGASLADKFVGAETVTVQIITLVMIIAMSGSQFYIQRMLMTKNMPVGAQAAKNPFMQQQKVMLYLFPIMFAVFGINFPVGVLLYWLISNLWSVGQQLYVIRRMPALGSLAHEAMLKRRGQPEESGGISMLKKGGGSGGKAASNGSSAAGSPPDDGPKPARAQPQRQSRNQRSSSKKR